jgi:hypothetical protein
MDAILCILTALRKQSRWVVGPLFFGVERTSESYRAAKRYNRQYDGTYGGVEGLAALKKPGATAQVFTDSNYVVKGANHWLPGWITRGWKNARGQEIAHLELWQRLKTLLDRHHVTLTWVPREENAQADELAQQAARHEVRETTKLPLIPRRRNPPAHRGPAAREAMQYARRVVRRARTGLYHPGRRQPERRGHGGRRNAAA